MWGDTSLCGLGLNFSKLTKCPLTEGWIKKMNNVLLLRHTKEQNKAIHSNTNGPRDYHTKWSKSKTNIIRYHLLLFSHLICVWLCDPMDYSTLVFSVLRYLLEFAQIHVHWVGDAICLILCSLLLLCLQSFPASGSFPMISLICEI